MRVVFVDELTVFDEEEESFIAEQVEDEKQSRFDDISSYCTGVVVKASKAAMVDLAKSPSTSFPVSRAPSSIGGRSGAEGREKESATST